MTAAGPYVDTSALAKWYLAESGAAEFEAFITEQKVALISRLCVVEFHCLLGRRRRAGELRRHHVVRVIEQFERQIAEGEIEVHPLDDRHAIEAVAILKQLADRPLRTLDALHLAIALEIKAPKFATADQVLGLAARAVGLDVALFA